MTTKLSSLSGRAGEPHPLYADDTGRGGRDHPQPEFVSRRVQVAKTDHPRTDRWITLSTTLWNGSYLYVVGVVDGRNRRVEPPEEFPTFQRARTYANKLYNEMTEETER